ncbi:MAG: PTS sugar transporter subunit IIA [Planctomycetota bacterium]
MTKIDQKQENEVMTLPEVAEYLQLAEKTVLRMVQRGEIPAAKIASQWRFMRPVIRDWLAGRMQTMPSAELESLINKEKNLLPLTEVIRPDLITLNIAPGPKEYILRQLVTPLRKTRFAKDPALLLQNLIDRERIMTTAVGHGIALPHPRRPIERMFKEPAVVLGLCPQGTNFEAVDDKLVHLFFLICATREEIHLQLMAKVSWLTRNENIRSELQQVSSQRQAVDIIAKAVKILDVHSG